MAMPTVFLVILSCITVAYSATFAESPFNILLKNNDIRGLETLVKSTWHLRDSSQVLDSKWAPLVSGHWDSSLTCRCSNLAQIILGEYQSNNTWGTLIDFIYPADSPARFREFPHLSACLMLPAYLPMPAPPAKSHWDLGQIMGSMKDMTQTLGLGEEDEQDLLFSVLELGSILGLDSLGVATRMGMLSYLDYQLQDITKAIGLQKIFEKVDDIANSSDTVGVFKFLVNNFRSHACSKSFLEKLLVECFETGNDKLVEYIHDNHLSNLKEALLGSFKKSNHRADKSREHGSKSISCMSSAPMSLIRLMCSRGTFDQPLLNTAAHVCRADIVEAVHQEFNGMLPSNDGILTALSNGCTRVIDYVSPLMPTLAAIIAEQNSDDEFVDNIVESGSLEGYKLLLRFLPSAFPPSEGSLAEANADDYLEMVRFIFFKLLESIDPAILATPSQERQEKVQEAINVASSDFAAIRWGSARLIRFFKSQCEEFGIEFPEITTEDIMHSLNNNHRDFLDEFESIFDRPIPYLAEIAQIGVESVSSWLINVFTSRGYNVKVNESAQVMSNLTDLARLQTLHEYCPHVVPIDSSQLCSLLSEEAPTSFEWALTHAQPDAVLKTCVIAKVHPASLPQYKVAHSAKGWLPSQENIDSAAKAGHLEFLEWAFRASKGSLFPSPQSINQVFHSGDVVTLRLLHHLRPLDFHQYAFLFMMSARIGDLNLLQWFPEYKSKLLNHADSLFPEDVAEWIRTNDEVLYNGFARMMRCSTIK